MPFSLAVILCLPLGSRPLSLLRLGRNVGACLQAILRLVWWRAFESPASRLLQKQKETGYGGFDQMPLRLAPGIFTNSTKDGQTALRGGPTQKAPPQIARKGDLPDSIVQAGLTDRDLSDAADPQSHGCFVGS